MLMSMTLLKMCRPYVPGRRRRVTTNGYMSRIHHLLQSTICCHRSPQVLKLKLDLWRGTRDFGVLTSTWVNTPLLEVDTTELEKVVSQYSKMAYRCSKGLPGNPVVPRLKESVDTFAPVLPVVVDLRNDSLKQRHWDQIHGLIGFTIQGDDGFTLGSLIERGVTKFSEEITGTLKQDGFEVKTTYDRY